MNVHTLFMKVGVSDENEKEKKVKHLAAVLEVPLKIVDVGTHFKKEIIDYFIKSYKQGLTPNPCVLCNQKIKFKLLWEVAFNEEGTDAFATGHYADKILLEGKYFLKEPVEKDKSQNYFLSMITGERLVNTIFPLSGYTVSEVREMVRKFPLTGHRESQDVCFIGQNNLIEYLKDTIPKAFRKGDIINTKGDKIGNHRGAIYFTIGQRRGTRFPSDRKLYVIEKDVKNNTIVLGDEMDLFSNHIQVRNPVFWGAIQKGEIYQAKVRYLSDFVDLEVIDVSGNQITGRFTKPVRAITPGQIAVFYKNDIIMAAGPIF